MKFGDSILQMKKTPKITVLIGCPASGKSTYAEWIVRTEPKTMRVSRDEIRFSQFQETVDPIVENIISKIIYQQVKTLVGNGWNVIIDNCHTKLEYINQHISDYNELADIDFKLFDLPMETLQERNAKRSRKVPVNVIKNMFKNLQYVKEHFDFQTIKKVEKKLEYTSQNPDLQKAIICDLDGTLSLLNGRNPFDASNCENDLLNKPVANLLINYKKLGFKIILLSGREDKYKVPTLQFLANHKIEFDQLLMRKSDDFRKDAIIKKEIFNAEIKCKYFVEMILDDRNQVVDMWRNDLQLPCFQVNYGDF